MRQELEDSWNTIILAMTTRGGYMTEKSSRKYIYIPESNINLLTDRPETSFKQFQVNAAEYTKILKEVRTLREELYLRDEELKLKKEEAARKRAETRARNKKKTAENKTSSK